MILKKGGLTKITLQVQKSKIFMGHLYTLRKNMCVHLPNCNQHTSYRTGRVFSLMEFLSSQIGEQSNSLKQAKKLEKSSFTPGYFGDL